jgi:hypothetical protein
MRGVMVRRLMRVVRGVSIRVGSKLEMMNILEWIAAPD